VFPDQKRDRVAKNSALQSSSPRSTGGRRFDFGPDLIVQCAEGFELAHILGNQLAAPVLDAYQRPEPSILISNSQL
jgi:hypothetical protein